MLPLGRSQAQRDLRHGSAAGRLLELWVRILPGGVDVCVFVSDVCCQGEVFASG